MNSAALTSHDLDLLLQLYEHDPKSGDLRRPPWTWAALIAEESAALARLVDAWVETYNHTLATRPEEIVPPCWRQHPGLADELAVQVWLYYAVHHHSSASPAAAGEYYLRHLPGFRSRIEPLLGRSPVECRAGQHVDTWRSDLDQVLNAAPDADVHSASEDALRVEHLTALHFGFRPE